MNRVAQVQRGIRAGATALIVVAPFLLPAYVTFEIAYAGTYAIAILGVLILTGHNGQISLGHGAFVAVGAYVVAIAAQRVNLSPAVSLPLAAILCGLLGLAVGVVVLRLRGAYLALATFALAVALGPTIKRFGGVTGGPQGITLPTLHAKLAFMSGFTSEQGWYALVFTIFAALCALTRSLLEGRLGRALRALRDNEIAALSFGINPSTYKALAFGWSAAYAGIAGGLFALLTSYVSPDSYPLELSITLLIGAVLGGLGTLWGALIGGIIVEFLPLWSQALNPAAASLVYGVALIAVILALPGGIATALGRAQQRWDRAAPGTAKR